MPDAAEEEAAMLEEMLREDQKESRAAGAPSLGDTPKPQQQPQAQPTVVPIRQELIARWPDGKTLVVARCVVYSDGQRKIRENWRPATDEEKKLIPSGSIIQGGVAAAPSTETAPATEPEKKGWPMWAKILATLAGAGAVGGVGYYLWTSDGDDDDDYEEE